MHHAVCLLAAAVGHGENLPVNPALGVPGYPDCTRANPHLDLGVEAAAADLVCRQRSRNATSIKIG